MHDGQTLDDEFDQTDMSAADWRAGNYQIAEELDAGYLEMRAASDGALAIVLK